MVFAALVLLALGSLSSMAQTPTLKAIPLRSFMSGIPITVNGVVHVTPATVTVNVNEPLALSAPTLFDRGDGFRFRLLNWRLHYQDGRPVGDYATESVQLPDARELSAIDFNTLIEIRIDARVSGPGAVVWDPPLPPDGFIPIISKLKLTPVPNQNAYFAGWDAPWDYDEGAISIGAVTVPLAVTAHFLEKVTPPLPLILTSDFPDLSMRSKDAVFEGQVLIQSAGPTRVRNVDVACEPRNLFFNASPLSSRATPFWLKVGLTAENNIVPNGLYACAILINRYDGIPPYTIPFRVRIGEAEPETPPAVLVSGASFAKTPLAPGAIFSLFGENIGLATEQATALPLPQSLGGNRVRIQTGSGNYDAPLFYVSPNQINFLAPLDLPIGAGTLEILREGANGISIPVVTEWQAPALFSANATGSGAPAGYYMRVLGERQERGEFVNCPNERDCAPVPIHSPDPAEEVYLVLFGTGFRNASSIQPQVRMGGMVVEATYFGAHRDFAGLDQINVKVPRALLGAGAQPVAVTHGGKQSNTVTIEF